MVDYSNDKYSVLPKGKKVLIITDSTVASLYLWELHRKLSSQNCDTYEVILPAGETSKNLANVQMIYESLSDACFTRTDYIIALGGGVITDIAGFCAATYLRGMKYISIPTTLLAMVDAAHGGKCGVDLECGKNLVGTFYEPEHIICDINFLRTLSKECFIEGMAEVIKYAFIIDKSLYDLLNEFLVKTSLNNMNIASQSGEENGWLNDDTIEMVETIVGKCIDDKKEVVRKDLRDFGTRRILNFGHTYGHALEVMSGYRLSHGYAVSVGMVMITQMAVKRGLCDQSVLDALKKLLESFELPVNRLDIKELAEISEDDFSGKIMEIIGYDKKHDGDDLYVAIVDSIGSSRILKYEELV